MVEGIEEVGSKTKVKPFADLEMLVGGQVVVPRARSDDVIARIGVVESTERSVVARPIAQRNGKLANKLSRAIRASWPNARRSESTADSGYLRGVEIASEPLAIEVGTASDIHDSALTARDADIPGLDETSIHAHPEAAVPRADHSRFPTPDYIIEWCGNITTKVFAFSERKLVNPVESDAVGRDGGVIEEDEVQSLVVAQVWLTEQFDIFRHGRPAALPQNPISAAAIDRGVSIGEATGIGSGEGTHVGVKPLKAHAIGKLPAEFQLSRMVVGIAGMVYSNQSPPWHGAQ